MGIGIGLALGLGSGLGLVFDNIHRMASQVEDPYVAKPLRVTIRGSTRIKDRARVRGGWG